MPRGGKREGAGRKTSESTKRISVPEKLVPEVESMIFDYKNGVEKPFPELLIEFIGMFPEYKNNQEVLAGIGMLFEDWELLKKVPRNHRKIIIKMLQKT